MFEVPCATCGGEGCEVCGGCGHELLAGCPLDVVGPSVWPVLEACEVFASSGLPPVAGGMLDQTQCFVDAWRVVRSTRRRLLNERKIEQDPWTR